jgi:hypothetical protein
LRFTRLEALRGTGTWPVEHGEDRPRHDPGRVHAARRDVGAAWTVSVGEHTGRLAVQRRAGSMHGGSVGERGDDGVPPGGVKLRQGVCAADQPCRARRLPTPSK